MVCILKKPGKNSPGIMIFTHNEYLFGGLRYQKIYQLLANKSDWCFGIHIQGDCSFLKEWPDCPYIDFIMWPNLYEPFLQNVKHKIIQKTCVFFYPTPFLFNLKKFDICVTSRASEHKNFNYSLELIKKILEKRPRTSVVFLTPDTRKHKSLNFNKKDNLYFNRVKYFFTEDEMYQISFISPSQESFGLFPITSDLYWTIINLSKTILLTSLVEGTPRCIVEGIIHQTMPCVMKDLKSGLKECLSTYNMIRLDYKQDEQKIINYLEEKPFHFNETEREIFLFDKNWTEFIKCLNFIKSDNVFKNDDPSWIKDNLTNRLAGHLKKGDVQLTTQNLLKKYLHNFFNE